MEAFGWFAYLWYPKEAQQIGHLQGNFRVGSADDAGDDFGVVPRNKKRDDYFKIDLNVRRKKGLFLRDSLCVTNSADHQRRHCSRERNNLANQRIKRCWMINKLLRLGSDSPVSAIIMMVICQRPSCSQHLISVTNGALCNSV